jgi:hypothetical protein
MVSPVMLTVNSSWPLLTRRLDQVYRLTYCRIDTTIVSGNAGTHLYDPNLTGWYALITIAAIDSGREKAGAVE